MASWVIATEYLVTLRSLITFNGAKPCKKCVFQYGESGIVELSFIFYEATGYGQGWLLTRQWVAEMMANGIIECWAGVADLWYLSSLHAQRNWHDSRCPAISF
jgi:hypothetical protein